MGAFSKAPAHSSTSFPKLLGISEKQRDAPNGSESDHRVNDSRPKGRLTAEDPSDKVKSEKSDASPVEAADNAQRQANSVH